MINLLNNPKSRLILLSFLLGAITYFAFPNSNNIDISSYQNNFGFLGFISLCFYFLILYKVNHISEKLYIVFFYTLAFYLFNIYWLYYSIHFYGQINLFLSYTLTLLCILFLCSISLLSVFFYNYLYKKNYHFLNLVFLLPTLFVLTELVRGQFFPWVLIGYTQLDTPFSFLSRIGSVYFVSYVTAMVSGILAYAWYKKYHKIAIFLFLIVITLTYIPSRFFYKILQNNSVAIEQKVTLIPGNIPMSEKFSDYDPCTTFKKVYLSKIIKAAKEQINGGIFILPENTFYAGWHNIGSIIRDIYSHKNLLANKFSLIFGSGIYNFDEDTSQNIFVSWEFNNSNLFEQYIYSKVKLVPFGEYTPFYSICKPILEFIDAPIFTTISGKPQNGLALNGVVPSICYEIIFPELIKDNTAHFSNNSNAFIVNISEDGWFGDTIGPVQIAQMARMRALENNIYLVRVSNNGFTSVVNNYGEIVYLNKSLEDSNQVHNLSVPMLKPKSFYYSHGLFIWVMFWIGTIIVFITIRHSKGR